MTKSSDIRDADILRTVYQLCKDRAAELGYETAWTHTFDVQECFWSYPTKVVAAKLSKLLRRELLTGCDCGCRGDWELTEQGLEMLMCDWVPLEPKRFFSARPYCNDPPYLFHIANYCSDVPSALHFLEELAYERELLYKEMRQVTGA